MIEKIGTMKMAAFMVLVAAMALDCTSMEVALTGNVFSLDNNYIS
jgi:hypothetical protein